MNKIITIGRAVDNMLVLDQPQISAHHAELHLPDGGNRRLRIKDLNSANGVYKNGQRVTDTEFDAADKLALANVELKAEMYFPLLDPAAKGTASVEPGPGKAVMAQAPAVSVNEAGSPSLLGRLLGWGLFGVLLAGLAYVAEMRYAPQVDWRITPPGTAQMLAYILISWSLLWAGMNLFAAYRRARHERRRQVLALSLWETRLEKLRKKPPMVSDDLPGWNGWRKFEISRKVQEGGDICSFYLTPHDKKALPGFKPGQYLTFQLHIPGQDKAVIRCYSLSETPLRSDFYRVSIKRQLPPGDVADAPPGLSSSYFHDQLNVGDILDVKAPGGHFHLDADQETPVVLIGGGVGLTPVLSMLNTIVAGGSKRETWLFYGVRNSGEHIQAEHLQRLQRSYGHVNVRVCYSRPLAEDQPNRDYDHAGRIDVAYLRKTLPSNNYEFYVCGPSSMMDTIVTDLETWGVPERHVHFEAFGPASAKQVHPNPATTDDQAGFEVRFERSGKSCRWEPSSGSLLDLAEAQGVAIDFGCRAGNCGTCSVALKRGKTGVIHEPGIDVEEGSCLACVSRPEADLVIDA